MQKQKNNLETVLLNYLGRKDYTTSSERYMEREQLRQEIKKPQYRGGSPILDRISQDELDNLLENLVEKGRIISREIGNDTLFKSREYAVIKRPKKKKRKVLYEIARLFPNPETPF